MKAIVKSLFILLFYAITNSVGAQCPTEIIVSATSGTSSAPFADVGQTFKTPASDARQLQGLTLFSGTSGNTTGWTISIYEGKGWSGTLLYNDTYTKTVGDFEPIFFEITDGPIMQPGSDYTFRVQVADERLILAGSNAYVDGDFVFNNQLFTSQDFNFQIHSFEVVETPTVTEISQFNLSTTTVAASYQWYEDDNLLTGETATTLSVQPFFASESASKSYTVEATYANGCSAASADYAVNGIPECTSALQINQSASNKAAGGTSYGQSFTMPTAQNAYILESISLESGSGAGNYNVTLSIYEGEGYSGRLLHSESIPVVWPGNLVFVRIYLTNGPALLGGNKYSFRIQNSGNHRSADIPSAPYAGGVKIEGSGTLRADTDLTFRLYTFAENELLDVPIISAGAANPDGSIPLTASSTGAFEFQWYQNNVLIVGETSGTYTVPSDEKGIFNAVAVGLDGCGVASEIFDLDPPNFTSSTVTSVQENSTNISYTAEVTDNSEPISFSLATENDESFFAIDPNSGVLSMSASLDFESPQDGDSNNEYEVSIVATDAVNNIATLDLVITVEDIDENDPVITSLSDYQYADGGTSVVFSPNASDESAVTFSLGVGLDNALFTLAGGEVSFNTSPSFTSPIDSNGDNVYEIELIATDALGNTSTKLINITILEQESDLPVITSSATSSIVEESDLLAYTITANDASAITYLLGTTKDETHFEVDESSGEVSFINAPDFENPIDAFGTANDNSYVIDVIVTDLFDNTTTQEVIISVTNNPSDECNDLALKFDGSNDYIELSETLAIGGTPFTIEMWIKTNDGSRSILLGNYDTSINGNFEITTAGTLRVYWNTGNPDLTGSAVVDDNEWHHIAFVRDAVPGAITIFVDGEVDATSSTNANAITFSVNHRIGADRRSGTHYYGGSMDDLRIWNEALTSEEISASIGGSLDLTSSGLLSNYTFDEGTGTTLIDTKGSNDGTLSGGPVWERINGSDPSDPLPQVITFDALPSKTVLDINTSFELTATGGLGGNPVTYSSSDETVATISGTTVTIVGTGTTTISADQTGVACYAAASQVQQVLTVNKADQAIIFNALAEKIFGEADFDLSATGGASGNPVTYTSSDESVATISGNTVTILAAGTIDITASQAGDDTYNEANATQQLVVNKAPQSIVFDPPSQLNLLESTYELIASGGGSGNPVFFQLASNPDVATLNGSTLTLVGTGGLTIRAVQLGNENYLAAASPSQVITIIEEYIWNGTSWNNGSSPPANKDILIQGDFMSSINGTFVAANLEVAASVTLTVDSESTLEVNGDLTNDGNIIIESGSSLITYAANILSGNDITIKRSTRYADGKYSFVGTPVEQDAGILGSGLGSNVYSYNETIAFGAEGINRWEDASADQLIPGTGYTQAFQEEITFTGIPNDGSVTHSGTYTEDTDDANEGWNLVSNPYPAAIRVSDFLTENTNLAGAVYIWDDNGSDTQRGSNADYIVANGTMATNSTSAGGETRYNQHLGSSQGFFVKLNDNSELDITFLESMRVADSNADVNFFRSAPLPLIRVNLTNQEGLFKQAVIGIADDANSEELNRTYDAPSFNADVSNGIFTQKLEKALALNGQPMDWQEVALQINTEETGSYQISIETEHYDEAVFLRDTQTGEIVDLTQTEYSFNITEGINYDRFQLLSLPSGILGSEEINTSLIYAYESKLYIIPSDNEERAYKLFTISGSEVLTHISKGRSELNLSYLDHGVYMVFDGEQSHKIILK